ncbi:MAG: hypothetical protein A2Z16_14820 [Chloroflexi bacterium RBG_16_54_18]|nr:MAG: hypothetical protein A2Z16_14820 [Chloroflexi bacterium RBG_16_54_18]
MFLNEKNAVYISASFNLKPRKVQLIGLIGSKSGIKLAIDYEIRPEELFFQANCLRNPAEGVSRNIT